MGRRYSAIVSEAALAAATDLIRIVAQTNRTIKVYGVSVTTDASAADAMKIQIQRATGGSSASAITPEKKSPNDTAFSGTAFDLTGAVGDTTPTDIIDTQRVEVRAGYYWKVPVEDGIEISGAGIFAVRLDEAITSAQAECVVDFEEIG